MSEKPEIIFLKRRQQNEQQNYEKVFTITNYQGNTNSNHSTILLHISHGCYKKIRLIQAKTKKLLVFPVVMYKCESWTIKKAEYQRIDAFELWFGEDC